MGFFELEVSSKSADQHSLAAVPVGLAVPGDVLGRLASASGPGVTSVYLKVRFWMPWGSTLDCFVEHLFIGLRPMTCILLQPMSPSIRIPRATAVKCTAQSGPKREAIPIF